MTKQSDHKITRIQTINAPLAKVWQVVSDFDNPHLWAPGVTDAHKIGPKDKEVGAKRYCKLADFGSIEEEVTQWTENEGYTYEVTPLGPLTNTTSRWKLTSVTPESTQLEVSIQYDIRFSVFGKLMHNFIMKSKLNQSIQDTLSALQQHVEKAPFAA
ncbi:SRPBCC family protein [Paraglaciecola sp.]|uniref:SRPBCC family protein n=1 Tax=Paraglaciecola sp. TaxID=1920173 RepID=UPI003EF18B14